MTHHEPGQTHAWDWDAASQQGGRHEQQDRWGVFQTSDPQGLLAIVADGMGGHLDGALGAQIVIDAAQEFVQSSAASLHDDPPAALQQLCQQMHEAINNQAENARSTVVMVWIEHERACWLNVGDSRLYHFRRGRRLMRTHDHSVVQLLTDLGEIDESQMATHPAQNRLYRCLGGEESPKPNTGDLAIQAGDLLVLCSDGVWEHITEPEIWTAVLASGTAATRLLTERAVQRGGAAADNATLVLLRAAAGNSGDPPGWMRRLAAGFAALFNRNRR